MAKGSLFVGSGSGKVGNLVLANTKSGQVTRAYQPKVSNPKTRAQMLQRAKFADAVKFFKEATAGFFKFAFEDKASNESDYNAFMRHNIKYAIPMSREQYENISVPALGKLFQMSAGRLSNPITVKFVAATDPAEGEPKEDLVLDIGVALSSATIGAVSTALVSMGLQEGDIVTIVRIGSAITSANLEDLTAFDDAPSAPTWYVGQFIVNTASTENLSTLSSIGSPVPTIGLSSDSRGLQFAFEEGVTQFAAAVVTRKVDGQLYASNSSLIGDTNGAALIAAYDVTSAVEESLLSWGSKGEVILKGSIAD